MPIATARGISTELWVTNTQTRCVRGHIYFQLDTDATFVGPALWGFSSAMAYPPQSQNIFVPGTPFVNADEENYLMKSLEL